MFWDQLYVKLQPNVSIISDDHRTKDGVLVISPLSNRAPKWFSGPTFMTVEKIKRPWKYREIPVNYVR